MAQADPAGSAASARAAVASAPTAPPAAHAAPSVPTLAHTLRATPFRIAAGIVALFVVTAAVIGAILFHLTNQVLTDQVLSALRSEAGAAASEARAGGLSRLQSVIGELGRRRGNSLYFLSDGTGAKLAGNLSRLPPELAGHEAGGVFRYEAAPGSPARLAAAISLPLEGGARLVVGRDIEDQRVFAQRVRRAFLIGFGALALAGLAGGLAFSRLVTRRIARINDTSRSIMAGDLTLRIPFSGSGDEIDDLAQNLNAMLDRIEQLMTSLREVSDNIAHDLKTPLNRLRNRAEAALRDERGSDAWRDGLERTIEQADEVIKTFNALLLIARLEAGALAANSEAFDAAALVRDVAELYEPVAEEAGLTLVVEAAPGAVIKANRQLVGQAIANLIDNAIKYSAGTASARAAPEVGVRLAVSTAAVEIVVADRGTGIPAADRDRVQKRFVRLEASRTRPGTGLGLSLVAAVARLHGGVLRLEDNGPGLRATLFFPRRGAD